MGQTSELEISKRVELGDPPWVIGFARSHRGKVRSENQDRFALEVMPEVGGIIAMVADGMGGHTGGSQAAEIATVTILDCVMKSPPQVHLYEQLQRSFTAADEAIRDRASRDTHLGGMGTTGVAVVLLPEECVHIYTGDSRLYHFRDKQEVYRTKDHSVVRYLEDEGLLSEEEARTHPMRSRLTSSLGGGQQERKLVLEPKWVREPEDGRQPSILGLEVGDLLLLCSDGFCGEVTTPIVHQLVEQHGDDPEVLTQVCVEAALAAGGRDNITVVALKILSR